MPCVRASPDRARHRRRRRLLSHGGAGFRRMAVTEDEIAVPEIGVLRGETEHPLAHCADHDRRAIRARATDPQLALARRVEFALEVYRPLRRRVGMMCSASSKRLDAMIVGDAEGAILRFVIARAEAENQPAVGISSIVFAIEARNAGLRKPVQMTSVPTLHASLRRRTQRGSTYIRMCFARPQ